MYALSARSEKRLAGVHTDLVRVVRRALELSACDFAVVEGLRTKERQAELLAAGKSKTIHSRHITGHAVDLVPFVDGEAKWDRPAFEPVVAAMKQAAAELGIQIEAGHDWMNFPDSPHFQLPWKGYP